MNLKKTPKESEEQNTNIYRKDRNFQGKCRLHNGFRYTCVLEGLGEKSRNIDLDWLFWPFGCFRWVLFDSLDTVFQSYIYREDIYEFFLLCLPLSMCPFPCHMLLKKPN